MEIKALEKLGLTQAEIEAYTTLLRTGPITATIISKKTKLNRSHIYDTLTKLMDKGLISVFEKNKTKFFDASSPEKIKDYVSDLGKEIQKILPTLRKLKEIPKPITKVQLFQGKQGLKTILKDIIRERKDYVVFGEETQFQTIFPIYIHQFLRDIKHYKIKERLLTQKEVKRKLIKTENTQVRYLESKFFSPTTTAVYGNKVAIFIWSEPYNVTLIEDKEVANSYKNYFEQLWKSAKP